MLVWVASRRTRASRALWKPPRRSCRARSHRPPMLAVPVEDEQGGVVREDGARHCKASCGIKFGAFRLRIVQAC